MQEKLAQPSFLLLLVAVTILFGALLQPFFGAILWAAIIAILFYPVQQRYAHKFGNRRNLLALTTLGLCTAIVIVPLLMLVFSLVAEVSAQYARFNESNTQGAVSFDKINETFPIVQRTLDRFGIELGNLRQQLTNAGMQAGQYVAKQALAIGQNTAQFVLSLVIMLYLTFFFLRDGERLVQLLIKALPLGNTRERALFDKFAQMTRATVKGNLVVAMVQGALGGFIFWMLDIQGALLWGVVMAVLSLLPAVGAGLIWGPVAAYLLFTGAVTQGIILIAFGAGVIGLVDNVLRPILVGRDTKLPDYMVLISTLGGIALFGINGFVLGPLVAALFIAFWDIFIREFNP